MITKNLKRVIIKEENKALLVNQAVKNQNKTDYHGTTSGENQIN